jgi:5-methylcytosine-specific restriction endonuclease McrA
MPNDPFYRTARWRRVRAEVLARDGYTCVVPGCRRKATHVDHIHPRRSGGTDHANNLRSLCPFHDSQIKEMPSGQRFNRGELTVPGVDPRGRPLDSGHHWNRSKV